MALGNDFWETNAEELWRLQQLLEVDRLWRLLEAVATAGRCGDCWKLRSEARKASNVTENALSKLIFFVQLQQTEISNRKLSLFQSGGSNIVHS